MFQRIIQWIRSLFGKTPGALIEREHAAAESQRRAFENTNTINFNSIFGEALSKKATADSDIIVTDAAGNDSRRSLLIQKVLIRVWDDIKAITSQALGKGGKFLVPYVVGAEIYVASVDQSNCIAYEVGGGGNITSLSLLVETRSTETVIYHRIIDYTLENNNVYMRTKVLNETTEAEVPLSIFDDWADISPEIMISNADRLPVAYLKSPKDSRKEGDFYGVPITYGSGDIIRQLLECLEDIESEYALKKAFVGADEMLFGKDKKLVSGGLFKLVSPVGALRENAPAFWQVFDPAIRDSSYYSRWLHLCELLEKSVGTSKGILTEPVTAAATATEIKYANYDTFCLVADIRKNIEKCLNDLAYAVDLFAEAFKIISTDVRGDYSVTFDWDMSLLESSQETFAQLSELESRGLINPARLASWVTGDTLDQAQEEIDAARAASPPVGSLLGEM